MSPQARFTCPPCSILLPKDEFGNRPRLTFCSTTSNQKKLHLFRQKNDQDFDIASASLDIRHAASPVVHLDVISRSAEPHGISTLELLAVHEDGEISCYTDSFDKEIYLENPLKGVHAGAGSSLKVYYANVITIDEAQKALLKGREDVLATIDDPSELSNDKLLLLLTRSIKDSTLTLRLLNISSSSPKLGKKGVQVAKASQELLSFPIPGIGGLDARGSQIYFHVTSGILYCTTASTINTYDLAACIPRKAYSADSDKVISSCVRISSSLVAIIKNSTVSILNLRYNAFQARFILQKPHKSKKITSTNTRPILVTYNASLDVLVILQGRELQAFQLAGSGLHNYGSRKRRNEGLLIDSIGRGLPKAKLTAKPAASSTKSHVANLTPIVRDNDKLWKQQKLLIDTGIENGQLPELERLLSSEILEEGQAEDRPKSQAVTKESAIDSRTSDYIVSNIFDIITPADTASTMLQLSPQMKEFPVWLFSEGRLSDSQVEGALRRRRVIFASDYIDFGSVAQAIVLWDPSLRTLLAFLEGSAPLTAREVIHALRISILKEQKPDLAGGPRLLTQDEAKKHERQEPIDTLPAGNEDGANAPKAQVVEETFSQSILRSALKRFHRCSSRDVSHAMRDMLSRTESRWLIDNLRVDLARNGWLAPYIEEKFYASGQSYPEDTQICMTAHLLSCVVASLGAGGWLMSDSVAKQLSETAETIAYMKAEISAALEGIEEATYLKGMLGETLLCGKSFNGRDRTLSIRHTLESANERMQPTIVSVDNGADNLLPLGLKPQQNISMHKVGAGGERIRRSARDIGKLKSRMVPKYSFERIII